MPEVVMRLPWQRMPGSNMSTLYIIAGARARLPRGLQRAAGEYGAADGQPGVDRYRLVEQFPTRTKRDSRTENMYTTISLPVPGRELDRGSWG